MVYLLTQKKKEGKKRSTKEYMQKAPQKRVCEALQYTKEEYDDENARNNKLISPQRIFEKRHDLLK